MLAVATLFLGVAIPLAHRSKPAPRVAAKPHREKKPKRPPTSVVVRASVPNFSRNLHANQPVTIAFIGGSITQNAAHGGFVDEVPAWLRQGAPGTAITIVNAGIAGTGSDFGAQRIDRDVLVHRPDLVFVEFAVNDADRECVPDMERLVRKVRLASPETDIVFLYTVMDWSLPLLEQGKFPPSVMRHERVAEHYGIPTVALGYEAARKIRGGEWTWADFSADSCHPTPAGYASYNRDIDDALAILIGKGTPGDRQLPSSLTPGLVMHPPPAVAQPILDPPPLRDESGNVARQTFESPLFGVQWIGEPRCEGMWRLDYRSLGNDPRVDSTTGLDRTDWKLQRWFDEARTFTGSTSHPLVKSGDHFGSSPTEAAVLTWRAPSGGSWLIEVCATGLDGPRTHADAEAGVNVVRFARDGIHGESLALTRGSAFDCRERAELAAGDAVAFVFLARHFKFAHYQSFRVRVGCFGER